MNIINKEMEDKIIKELKKLLSGEVDSISFKNVSPRYIQNLIDADIEIRDTNGWNCDFWGGFVYDTVEYEFNGCAYDGRVIIQRVDL